MTEPENQLTAAEYRARRADRAQTRTSSSSSKPVIIGVAVALALVVVLVGVEVAATAGRVHPGVTVAGVPVGGMSPELARAALRTELLKRSAVPVTVSYKDKQWKVSAEQVGLAYDHDAQVARAMAVGRSGAPPEQFAERLSALVRGVELDPAPIADPALLASTLETIAAGTDDPAVNATVKMQGTTATVVDGRNGRALDRSAAGRLILAAFSRSGDHAVSAPVPIDRMSVTAPAAARAAKLAESMVTGPATITFDDSSWEFSREQIAKWLAFTPSTETTSSAAGAATDTSELAVYVSPKKAKKPILAELGTDVGRPAKNAKFKTSNGKVTIVPSQEGIGPDIKDLSVSLTSKLKNPQSDRTVALRTTRTQPKITTAKARSMGIKERISTYTTTYESGNRPRVNNIHLLGDALDGSLIEPGGSFSFNGAAGQRTAAKGYQEANAIVNGKLVPQLGGGVCQVGTTLFNTVFESGLPVLERRNHSFYISHYPKGRDATVSWGGPDLKFKNDTDHWVLVSVSYTGSSITISLYGTDPDYKVKAEVGPWRDERPFPTEEVKDPKMEVGSRIVEDSGISGRAITVKRIVKKGDKVVRTDTFVSKYRPKAQVVRVGTKKPKTKAPSVEATGTGGKSDPTDQ